jgi:hypothetical protein
MTEPNEALRRFAATGEPRGADAVFDAATSATTTPALAASPRGRLAGLLLLAAVVGAAFVGFRGLDRTTTVQSDATVPLVDARPPQPPPDEILAVASDGIVSLRTDSGTVTRELLSESSLLASISHGVADQVYAVRSAGDCGGDAVIIDADGNGSSLAVAERVAASPDTSVVALVGPADPGNPCGSVSTLSYAVPGAGALAVDFGEALAIGQPSWSPDGLRVATLVTPEDDGQAGRVLVDSVTARDGSPQSVEVAVLPAPPGEDWLAATFVGNDDIAVARATASGSSEILRLSVNGTREQELLGEVDGRVDWIQSDNSGQHLLLVARRGNGQPQLLVLSAGSITEISDGVQAAVWVE